MAFHDNHTHTHTQIAMAKGSFCENRQESVTYGKAQMQVRNNQISNTVNRMILEKKISWTTQKNMSVHSTVYPVGCLLENSALAKKFRKAAIRLFKSICLYLQPSSWNNSSPNGRIFVKFYIWEFFENLSREFKFPQNLTRIRGTLYEDPCSFMVISRRIHLRTKNFPDRIYVENQNAHFVGKVIWNTNWMQQ
jgi:hypothetical protein